MGYEIMALLPKRQLSPKAMQQKTPIRRVEDAEKERKWFEVDATGLTLGRLASQIAMILRGKHRADFTPHVDGGDGVIVLNAENIVVTGKKADQKLYRHHTLFPGGLKTISYARMQLKHPDRIIYHAVKGMVPHTRQTDVQMTRLRIFSRGKQHNMQAQQPIPLKF